jgi:rhodanese-related sulfurtransferase
MTWGSSESSRQNAALLARSRYCIVEVKFRRNRPVDTNARKEPAMTTHVTETTAAPSEVAIKHFQEMLAFETDCWDVHESLKSANPDFIVVDVRGPSAFAKGHVKGAINIPHSEMTATRMAEYPKDEVLVVYCAGPHCNGANKAALRLARLGLPVKMMIGGVTGWIDESFTLTPS